VSELASLRRQIRVARRLLSAEARSYAAERLAERLSLTHAFQRAERLAAYWAADGEMDPQPLMQRAWAAGKQVYLPVIGIDRRLAFARYSDGSPLRPNRFGIPEPLVDADDWCDTIALQLVLMPLVAFDERGTRLGMGGGFYDQTFSFVRRRPHLQRPLLIGAAYELQRVSHLERRPWDVPLDAVATEARIYHVSTAHPV
jgi:5-formyltetrahydrofolate cyclo-ligase